MRTDPVAERARQRQEDMAQRRREAAQRAAETRRRRREEVDRQAREAMDAAAADLGPTLAGERGRGRQRQQAPGDAQQAQAGDRRVEDQPEGERPTQGNLRARTRQRERRHADLLTIALRGPMAQEIRQLAADCNLNLSALLRDMALVYEGQRAAGYEAGTALRTRQETPPAE